MAKTYQITKEIHFNYGHRLLDYDGRCLHLHGHNAIAEITIEAQSLNSQDMVVDFADVDRTIGAWIDSEFDHRMLLRKDDPLVPILKECGEPIVETEKSPTAEAIAEMIMEYGRAKGLNVVQVKLWETPNSYATVS